MNKQLLAWIFLTMSATYSTLMMAESVESQVAVTTKSIASVIPSSKFFSRAQILAFKSVSHKISLLNAEYPELTEHSQQFDFDKSEQVITFLKKSKAYPKIKSILKDSKIVDLRQIFDISQKVMGGLYFLNRKVDDTNQSESQFETIRKVLLANLDVLKKQDESSFSNENEFLIKESEEQLVLLDKQLIIVKQALESLSDADKIFLEENAKWFKGQFQSSDNNSQR